jgi:hypothetical protein
MKCTINLVDWQLLGAPKRRVMDSSTPTRIQIPTGGNALSVSADIQAGSRVDAATAKVQCPPDSGGQLFIQDIVGKRPV